MEEGRAVIHSKLTLLRDVWWAMGVMGGIRVIGAQRVKMADMARRIIAVGKSESYEAMVRMALKSL